MFQTDLQALRNKLLAVNGIGPETADSILLLCRRMPSFVGRRLHASHFRPPPVGSALTPIIIKFQDYIQSSLPEDARLYNEYHALLGMPASIFVIN